MKTLIHPSQLAGYAYNPDLTGNNILGKGCYGRVFKGYHYNQETNEKGDTVAIK